MCGHVTGEDTKVPLLGPASVLPHQRQSPCGDVGVGPRGSLDVQRRGNARAWPLTWADAAPSGGDAVGSRESLGGSLLLDSGQRGGPSPAVRGTQKQRVSLLLKRRGSYFACLPFIFLVIPFYHISPKYPFGSDQNYSRQGLLGHGLWRAVRWARLGASSRWLHA